MSNYWLKCMCEDWNLDFDDHDKSMQSAIAYKMFDMRQQLEQAEARVAELEDATETTVSLLRAWKQWLPKWCSAYKNFDELPEIEKAEKALNGNGKAWLLRKQAEAFDKVTNYLVYRFPMKGYVKMMHDYTASEAQRLRQQADEMENET